MNDKFVINPEIEKLCEEKAAEEYHLELMWKERKLRHEIDPESIVNSVKSMINEKRLVIVQKGVSPFDKEVKQARFAIVRKYAEDAVKKVMEA
ncbi:MAG: hypothetical protein PHS04_18560 [Tissierellia bacterium]|nr:hypothetical protein [Tissierellia bacterium]